MSQHDFNIANQTFPSFRSDLNDALQAAATISAGATAPTTPYAYQLWYDTANEKYMIRNAANSAWLNFVGIDTNGNVTVDGLTVENTAAVITLKDTDTSDNVTGYLDFRTSADVQKGFVGFNGLGDFELNNLNNNGINFSSTNVLRANIASNGDISFYEDTGTTAKFFWDASAERLGIGTASPDENLQVFQTANAGNNYNQGRIKVGGTTSVLGFQMAYTAQSSGRASLTSLNPSGTSNNRIYIGFGALDSSGEPDTSVMTLNQNSAVGINTNSPEGNNKLDVRGWGTFTHPSGDCNLKIQTGNNTGFSVLQFGDTNDTDAGYVAYNHASNYMSFRTNGSGEDMRIDNTGILMVGKQTTGLANAGHQFNSQGYAYHTTDGSTPLYLNRLTTDGSLAVFYQNTNLEGSITVSGTTVSYNGGHLARWSQLADGTRDETIVKGTVLTNLDQMAVWHHEAVAATYYVEGDELPEITPATYYTEDDTLPEGVSVGDEKTAAVYAQIGDEKTPAADAYTEDNEQLNCMAVSSVEGDPNVAGVFVNWDNDDDEFNDMNIAMTGDMVIRIAQGTTVARGDLLMSAGDGTAKPQGDDIVRSKTIAKVTSTNVSHTYGDGSYLVPCVLMAC